MRIVIDTTPVFCPQVNCTIPLQGMLRALDISHYVVIKGTNSPISPRLLCGRMHPSQPNTYKHSESENENIYEHENYLRY